MSNKHLEVQEKVNKLVSLYKKDLLKEVLIEAKSLARQYPKISVIYNIYGVLILVLVIGTNLRTAFLKQHSGITNTV